MAEHVRSLTEERARAVGVAAYRRVLSEHTYAHRAAQLETILGARSRARACAPPLTAEVVG